MDPVSVGPYLAEDLTAVFGANSTGDSPEERARSSDREFVRSQVQLSFSTERATGHRLTAAEALELFGWDILQKVALDGSYNLISKADEPAATLRSQREGLNLTVDQLRRRIGLTAQLIQRAETPGEISRIRDLEVLGQSLAIDERVLGFIPEAHRDQRLGIRLRELISSSDSHAFSPASVLSLTEAAWVISRQATLARTLGFETDPIVKEPKHDPNYSYPTWEQGYRLAARTRQMLGLTEGEPIPSLRSLIEERLGIPLVQQGLAERFAGATLANGSARGIVVNERGRNGNVWVRRMTLCHEVGHLLWDPDQRLDRLRVDEYDDLEQSALDNRRDPVEIRANAFAISFLAPGNAVRAIVHAAADPADALGRVMNTFGISATAARHHVGNVTNLQTADVPIRALPLPSDEWIAQENLAVDWFPIRETPISRRGRFALLVAIAYQQHKISGDTASLLLTCSPQSIQAHVASIVSALSPTQPNAART
jgi:Zn-dependent peptidase ImmA (M78 family)